MRNLNKINIHRILALSVIFISFILITGLNNTNFTSFGTNVNNDINSKEKLKSNDLSTDNDLEGNGAPWNVTHYANRTKSDLAVSFNNNSYDDTHAQVELYGWNGYQLNSTITNLYDTRNWINGTFHAGPDDNDDYRSDNDSNMLANWTFKTEDTAGTNYMSGNYYDDSNIISDGADCVELLIGDYNNNYYDVGDKCWWETTFEIDRDNIDEAWLSFAVRPKDSDQYNNHFVLQVIVNDKILWGNGLQSMIDASGSVEYVNSEYWGQWYSPPSIYLDVNDDQLFPNGIKNMNVTLEFKRVSGNTGSGYAEDYSVLIDNVSLIVKGEAKPTQLELQLNGENVNDGANYGEGVLGITSNWDGSLLSSVVANFSSDADWPLTYNDDGSIISYKVELDTNLNLFTAKSTPESYYTADPSLEYQGSKFLALNSSNINWTTYAHMEVPAGYEETNMTIEFPSDYTLTGVFFSLNPNSISQTVISTYGNKKVVNIPVSSITSNTNGFWRLTAISPNYCEELNIYNNNTGDWELNSQFLSGDYINITGQIDNSLGYIQQTKAQLQIRFPNGTIWTTKNQIKSVEANGLVYFDPFIIPNTLPYYAAGEYEAIITWNNTYSTYGLNETGVIYKKFNVVHDALLYPDEGLFFIENIIDDRTINIKVSYRDLIDGKAIEDAYVYTNYTGIDEALIQTSPGFYLYEFNASDANVGNNTVNIYANSSFYLNKSITITVEVIKQTILTVESDFFSVPWKQNFTVRFNYTEKNNPSNGIDTTEINVDEWLGDYHLTQPSIGQYELTCNTSAYNTLTLQSFVISLTPSEYEPQSVLIRVQITELDSSIDNVILNGTSTTSIQIPWNELFDISVFYNDTTTSTFISGATVQLIGVSYSKPLIESGNEYIASIDTSVLTIGNNFLTILAQKENFNIASQLVTITVLERNTTLSTFLEETLTNSISLPYDESLNITVFYNDATGYFLDGAEVELRSGSQTLYPLTSHPTYNQYNLTINTNALDIGVNSLSIYAKKDNYTVTTKGITITVLERNTTLTMFLEESPITSVSLPYDEFLNITAIYNDATGYFLDGADVELRSGGETLHSLSSHPTYNQYNITINTKILNIGVNTLSVYAKRDNYSAASKSITITVLERNTNLTIFLDESPTTSLSIDYGELINITAIYKDLTGYFLEPAIVELRNGTSVLDSFSLHPFLNQYNLTIKTDQFSLGANLFSVYAKMDNYSAALASVVITVNERSTNLDVYLENIQTTSTTVVYAELFNITAIYEDFTGFNLDSALVELRMGSTTLHSFNYDGIYNQYYLIINSNEFTLGAHLLSIYAEQGNYETKLVSITITVDERDTSLDVLIEDINSDTFDYFNVSINDSINFTAIYNDFTANFISGATVELTGSGISEFLNPDLLYDQYTYILNAETLGVGVHFLVISASQENYTTSIKNVEINILERNSTMTLLIDDEDITTSKYVATEINRILNITVFFTDPADYSYIDNANIKLTGAINANFTELVLLQQYYVSLDTNTLEQGINFLTIFAQKENYESRSLIFTIEVKQKNTTLQLTLNDIDNPIDNSIQVTVGDIVNVTVVYQDDGLNFIDNATIIIVGEGLNQTLFTESSLYNQYNVSINTLDLNFGINILTLYAQKANYQPQTLIIRIEINEKETDMDVYLNGIFKNPQDRSINLPIKALLNITVKYFENGSGTYIPGSVIQLVGEGLADYYLTEYASFEQYTISINTSLLDIGVRFLTIYATHANFQSYSALLRIQVERIQTNITTTSSEIVFNRQPGDDFRLEVQLRDINFDINILNANVSYTWVYGQGTLSDTNHDGIYVATLSNLREGIFQITITAYAGDDYDFERFFITLNVIRPPEDVLLFQILTIAGIAAAVGISAYLIAYQRVLKYPKQVRKIRKFKSKLKKPKSIDFEVKTRDQLITEKYSENIANLEKQIKKKIDFNSETTHVTSNKIE
jgi:hypothetical protein